MHSFTKTEELISAHGLIDAATALQYNFDAYTENIREITRIAELDVLSFSDS